MSKEKILEEFDKIFDLIRYTITRLLILLNKA